MRSISLVESLAGSLRHANHSSLRPSISMCGNPRYRSLSRYYGDHSSNRFTSTLKLLNMGEGVKTLRIGTDTSAAKELIEEKLPYVCQIEVDGDEALDVITTCIDLKVPVILVAGKLTAEGNKKVASVLTAQSMSRLVGPGCRTFVIPSAGIRSAVNETEDYIPGRLGIIAVEADASTIIRTTAKDGMGHAAIFELASREGGTYSWELLQWMLSDSSKAEAICILAKNADTETLAVYKRYVQAAPENEYIKKVFAILGDGDEKLWEEAGIRVANDEGHLVELIGKELEIIDRKKATVDKSEVELTDIPSAGKTN
ncbi:hypothetical protein HD553DRAFT_313464 [Filobasidium floriforme]|uniref:uncharacterized protein n=1 Tax=Filobasidium floriforme TaxID=5210 RepID=UPI001E8E11DB|nr:uncharacterized protein HD553DRAFT_313464 [Filobasidium floriforme]KAH8083208.1 hypothetical protein HD553DRAFT_313464 [Filobasidium floriforme]